MPLFQRDWPFICAVLVGPRGVGSAYCRNPFLPRFLSLCCFVPRIADHALFTYTSATGRVVCKRDGALCLSHLPRGLALNFQPWLPWKLRRLQWTHRRPSPLCGRRWSPSWMEACPAWVPHVLFSPSTWSRSGNSSFNIPVVVVERRRRWIRCFRSS